MRALGIKEAGSAHAIVARWQVWATPDEASERLGADSDYYGRSLTWPHYVQAVATPGTAPGMVEPVPVRAGQIVDLHVVVRQGAGKVTGAAGPEFSLRLVNNESSGRTDL